MKISKYTFIFDVDNVEYYIYSTLSNALLEIDEESYLILLNAQKNKLDIVSSDLDNELYTILESKKFIVENDIDSFLYYKSVITAQRNSQSFMHLTIAPTMDCCFRCYYCFEEYKEKNYMAEGVMDSIIKYLNSLPSKPELKLTWFGGEPLMALSQMKQFYDKLMAGYKKPVSSNIITTGFHIDKTAIKIMEDMRVEQLQITLDGQRETHNSIKKTSECMDVFSKVLHNVDLILSTSDIHVVFRINLTKKNAHEYVGLYHYLVERFKDYKKKGIAPGFVMNRGVCENSSNSDSLFFSSKEAAQFTLNLWNKYQIHTPFLRYPSMFFTECAIRGAVAVSFDPEGYAYKCWEVIGNKKYAIGRLNKDGKLENINNVILNRHLYAADPLEDPICVKCRYLPICNGGCPIQRIENLFEKKKNDCCIFHKGKIKEFLSIYLKLKKKGRLD